MRSFFLWKLIFRMKRLRGKRYINSLELGVNCETSLHFLRWKVPVRTQISKSMSEWGTKEYLETSYAHATKCEAAWLTAKMERESNKIERAIERITFYALPTPSINNTQSEILKMLTTTYNALRIYVHCLIRRAQPLSKVMFFSFFLFRINNSSLTGISFIFNLFLSSSPLKVMKHRNFFSPLSLGHFRNNNNLFVLGKWSTGSKHSIETIEINIDHDYLIQGPFEMFCNFLIHSSFPVFTFSHSKSAE